MCVGTTGINLEMVINNSRSDASSVAGAQLTGCYHSTVYYKSDAVSERLGNNQNRAGPLHSSETIMTNPN